MLLLAIRGIAGALLCAVLAYALTPTLFGFTGGITLFMGYLIVMGFMAVPYRDPRKSFTLFATYLGVVLLVVYIVVAIAASSHMLHAKAFYELLGTETPATFSTALPPLDLQQPPLVSRQMAARAGEKKLSEIPALGSQVRLGSMVKQLVAGKLYWVALLHHQGLFKWNETGATPGYVMVSATDPNDVRLVSELDGKPLRLRYLTSAFMNDNLQRHLWLNGYANVGLTDITPEIDESGRPFYVVTRYRNTIAFSGKDAIGVVVVDIQTGDIKEYSLNDMPGWIDRAQPEEFVTKQISDRLYYMHGWWNPSDKDRQAVSGETDLVYGSDGKAYFYLGITDLAQRGGLTGFLMVDSRSKAVRRFTFPGLTEAAAQAFAQGVMPEKHYLVTNPLPFVVDGEPTYAMALCDDSGLARAYALVNMRNDANVVAVADTLHAATRLYQQKLSTHRTATDTPSASQSVSAKLKVAQIDVDVQGGTSKYYITPVGQKDVILVGSSDISEELVVTRPGQTIQVEYKKTPNLFVPIVHFDNLDVGK